MRQSNSEAVQYKWSDWGPGYLDKDGTAAVGILRLRDGDVYPDHCHRHQENAFFVLSGSATLWVDQSRAIELKPGDYVCMEPGEYHYFENRSGAEFRAVFIRAPYRPHDTVESGWTPS